VKAFEITKRRLEFSLQLAAEMTAGESLNAVPLELAGSS
jgi:hypothetical protein